MGESLGEAVVGFSGPGYTWATQQPPSLRSPNPSLGKINYLTLWDTAPPTPWKFPCHNLWNPVCSIQHIFLFCFFIFFSFILSWCSVLGFFPPSSPILHLKHCWGNSNINRLGVCQRITVGCSQPIHCTGEQTGASPSWESHRNTLLWRKRATWNQGKQFIRH